MTTAPSSADRRELGAALRRWAADGVGVVRVLDRHGFGTVESGQLLAGTGDGSTAGQVYLGALDSVAIPLALKATTAPAVENAHVAEAPAVAAGLACSGGAQLLGHPLPAELAAALGAAFERGTPAALLATVDGRHQLVLAGQELDQWHGTLGAAEIDEAAAEQARGLLRRGATATERRDVAGADVLVDLWVPVPSVLLVGSGAIGDAVLAQAQLLGWSGLRVTELDESLAAVEGFTDADVLVLLDHAPKFDALLIAGARRGRGFLGALGSRHTQSARRERLIAAGVSDHELARVRGPVGLDLGSRTPAETAVSIVAEVIASRSGRAGAALAAAEGRIGG
jgi:xanthine dehydrogenase accessory factor